MIITPSPSVMPVMAMRTINLEKVRLDLNDIRLAIKDAKFNAVFCFFVNNKYAFLTPNIVFKFKEINIYDDDKNFAAVYADYRMPYFQCQQVR